MLKGFLIGNVGKAPEVRYTKTNKKIATFSVASTQGTGDNAVTIWTKCEAWEKTADIVEKYVTKGTQVYIDGRIELENWTDKEGNARTTLKMTVTELKLLGSKGTSQEAPAQQKQIEPWSQEAPAQTKQPEPWSQDETGLPF